MNQHPDPQTPQSDASVAPRRPGYRVAIVLGLAAMLALGLTAGLALGGDNRGDNRGDDHAAGPLETDEANDTDHKPGSPDSESLDDDSVDADSDVDNTVGSNGSSGGTADPTAGNPEPEDGESDAGNGPTTTTPTPTPDPPQPTPDPSDPTPDPHNHPPVEIVGPEEESGPTLIVPGGKIPGGLLIPKLQFPNTVQFGSGHTAEITIHNPGAIPVKWTPGPGLRSVTWNSSGTTIQPGASATVKITVSGVPELPWERQTSISYGGTNHPIVLTGGAWFPPKPFDPSVHL